MHDIKHTRKSSLRLLKLLFVNLILFLIFVEIAFYAYFRGPIRFYYPFLTSITDIQTDFNVTYISDFKTGHRLVECQNNEKNKEILFVGDSFTWGHGLQYYDWIKNSNMSKEEIKDFLLKDQQASSRIDTSMDGYIVKGVHDELQGDDPGGDDMASSNTELAVVRPREHAP